MPYPLAASLLDSLGLGMCVFDAHDRTIHWNAHFLRFFPEHTDHVHVGEPYAENLRRFYLLRLPIEEHVHIDRYIQDGIRRHREQSRSYEFVHRGRKLRVSASTQSNGDRIRVWHDLSNSESALVDPETQRAITIAMGPGQTPDTLRVFDQLSDGVAIHDAQGRMVFANDRLIAIYGLRNQEEALGQTLESLVWRHWAAHADQLDPPVAADLHAALRDSLLFAGVPFEIPLPDRRCIRVTINAMAGEQTCSCHTDISRDKHVAAEMAQLTERLRQESHRDMLTGLWNRRGLHPLLAEASQGPSENSLLFIDLDGFKAVNDAAGHAQGDHVLCQVASMLQASVRLNDCVARMGGDEFVVLLKGCGAPQAHAMAQKIVDAVAAREFVMRDHVFRLGASVGVRTFQGGSEGVDVLLHDADCACYRAKRDGRGRVVVFGDALAASGSR